MAKHGRLRGGSFELRFLDYIPYPILVVAAIMMILAPFGPIPHVLEKLIMLKEGTLRRPMDIFDLIFHLAPAALLFIKLTRNRRKNGDCPGL